MTPAVHIDKARLLHALLSQLRADMEGVTEAQQRTQAATTHEEARPEHAKDTRATESSYLARGLAERMAHLQAATAKVAAMRPRAFLPDDPIAPGALVVLDGAQGSVHYLLAPAGGGARLDLDGVEVLVVTPDAPIGRALLGKSVSDDVIVKTPRGANTWTVRDIA